MVIFLRHIAGNKTQNITSGTNIHTNFHFNIHIAFLSNWTVAEWKFQIPFYSTNHFCTFLVVYVLAISSVKEIVLAVNT